MARFRSNTVNLCDADHRVWRSFAQKNSTADFIFNEQETDAPFTLVLRGKGMWETAPRHLEPERPYRLECDMKGTGRLGIRWIREGRPITADENDKAQQSVWASPDGTLRSDRLTTIGEVWSDIVTNDQSTPMIVKGVCPITANRAQVLLEACCESETIFSNPYLDGLGDVPFEIILPAAFQIHGRKVAVIALSEPAVGGGFEVCSSEGIVFTGKLTRWGEHKWAREYWYADFSDIDQAGSYLLSITLDDGRETIPPEFKIDNELYLELSRLTRGWYRTQRCGVEVPGWHPACHLDDALIGHSYNRRLGPGGEWTITGEADLTGGWHDAGDNHKYICWSYLALWALARLSHIDSEQAIESLEEAAWEADFLLRAMSSEGLFPLGVISRFGWTSKPMHEETDNLRGTGDERALPTPEERIYDIPTYGPIFTSALVASSFADLALVAESHKPELAESCLRAARMTWRYHHEAEPPDSEYLRWHSAFALLDASLLRHESSRDIIADFDYRIGNIIAQQKPEGIFPFPRTNNDYREQMLSLPKERRALIPDLGAAQAGYAISHEAAGLDYIPAPFTYLHALLDYLDLFPEGTQADSARAALNRALELALSLTRRTPFGHLMEWTIADDPAEFVHMFHGYNLTLLSLAVIAARAAKQLNRGELLGLAETQIQWTLGRNPRGTSLVCGVGHKSLGVFHTGLSHYEEHRTGEQPGGVVNGFVSMGAPRLTYSGPPYPWDFPYLDIRTPSIEAGWRGLDADWWTNETWVPNCSWFILAAVALHEALTQIAGPKH